MINEAYLIGAYMAYSSFNRILKHAGALGEKTFGGVCMNFRQICDLLWPLFIDQIYLQGINLANTAMIASYGPEAISAVSIVGAFNVFVTSVFIAIATGCAVVVAQYFGRREHENARKAAAQAIVSTLMLTIIISTVIFIFKDTVIMLLLGKGEPLTQEYARIFLIGQTVSFPLYGLMQTVMSALRGAGNTKASIFFSTGINTLNVVLNVLFLYVFRLGVVGLALSVILCRVAFALISILYMLHRKNILYTPLKYYLTFDIPLQLSILFVALPTGLEQIFFHGGRILTQVFIVSFGTASTAANAVGITLNGMLMITGNTLSMALLTITGQCIGMGNIDEAKRYIKLATNTGIVTSAFTSLLILPFVKTYINFYNLSPEVDKIAYGLCLMLLVGTPMTWCVSFITPCGLRAGGDATFSSVVSLICMWSVRVGIGYVLGVIMGYGVYGVWTAMFTEWAIRGVIFHFRARGSKWYRHDVIKT